MSKKVVIINRETLINSVLKDSISTILIIILGLVNYKFMGQSEVINFFVVLIGVFSIPKFVIPKKDGEYFAVDEKVADTIEEVLKDSKKGDL